MIYFVDDGPHIVELGHRTRVARKRHTCCVCKSAIEPGTRYECTVAIYDGDFLYEVMHIGAHNYPSLCPPLNAKDLAEIDKHYP